MTITVGRLLVCVSGLLVAVVLLWLAWSWFGPSGPQSFAENAQEICRQERPAIADSRDFRSVLNHSRDLRSRLSTLTPPPGRQRLFSQWLADLHAAEKAGARGKWLLARQYHAGAQLDVRKLGLSQRCVMYFR